MNEKVYEDAHDLSTELLIYLGEKKIDPNVCRAALGTAWIRLCEGMYFPKETFQDMCQGMIEYYKLPDDPRRQNEPRS